MCCNKSEPAPHYINSTRNRLRLHLSHEAVESR
jgi:hypothetical protein